MSDVFTNTDTRGERTEWRRRQNLRPIPNDSNFETRGSKRIQDARFTRAVYLASLRDLFETRTREWFEDTQWQSSISSITRHPQFNGLVSLGPVIISFVLQKLKANDVRVHWFPLLKDLSGLDPVPPNARGHVNEMARYWLDWGRQTNLVD